MDLNDLRARFRPCHAREQNVDQELPQVVPLVRNADGSLPASVVEEEAAECTPASAPLPPILRIGDYVSVDGVTQHVGTHEARGVRGRTLYNYTYSVEAVGRTYQFQTSSPIPRTGVKITVMGRVSRITELYGVPLVIIRSVKWVVCRS